LQPGATWHERRCETQLAFAQSGVDSSKAHRGVLSAGLNDDQRHGKQSAASSRVVTATKMRIVVSRVIEIHLLTDASTGDSIMEVKSVGISEP
jgi:hypothetical protein